MAACEKRAPPNFGTHKYHVSCEPLRIFWNDDTTCSTRVPRMLSTTGWKARNPARSRQHAWYSSRAGCIVFSENPQGLATHMVQWVENVSTPTAQASRSVNDDFHPKPISSVLLWTVHCKSMERSEAMGGSKATDLVGGESLLNHSVIISLVNGAFHYSF